MTRLTAIVSWETDGVGWEEVLATWPVGVAKGGNETEEELVARERLSIDHVLHPLRNQPLRVGEKLFELEPIRLVPPPCELLFESKLPLEDCSPQQVSAEAPHVVSEELLTWISF